MTDSWSHADGSATTESTPREVYAEAFDRSVDPLAEFSDTFDDLPDPFEYFVEKELTMRDSICREETIETYRRAFRHWREYMETQDRHPACPNPDHVQGFIEEQRDVQGNSRRTITGKLNVLSQAYRFWQSEASLPHPTDFDPFDIGKRQTDLGTDDSKAFPPVSLPALQEKFSEIQNIQRRAIIGLQLKLGTRAGEVSNIKISDLHISQQDVQANYPELGTHSALDGYRNTIYIPHNREGNKSKNPRLLPVDDELRWLLQQHLLTRPAVDESWVFLSEWFTQLSSDIVVREWKKAFHPEYTETDEYRGITSHFGRHWFSTYWRLEGDMNREHVQYMRGDRVAPIDSFPDAIDGYLHPRYEHIESEYRSNIFKLNLQMRHRNV